jgi:hypothetical protein
MSEDAPQFAANVQPLEEVPHIPGVNASLGDSEHIDPESPSVEHDPAKAYEMAIAGDENRTKATANRVKRSEMMTSTEVGETGAAVKHFNANQLATKANDEEAKMREELAGQQYDANKTTAQIPSTEEVDNPYPDRVEDLERAHVMALAGDYSRTEAAKSRKVLQQTGDRTAAFDPTLSDANANHLEEEAGRQYDVEHQNEPTEKFSLPMSVDEFFDVYNKILKYDDDSPVLYYLNENVLYNDEFKKQEPEKALELAERFASDPESVARSVAVRLVLRAVWDIDKSKGVEMLKTLLQDSDPSVAAQAVEEGLEPLFDNQGKIPDLSFEEAAPLFKLYADNLAKKAEQQPS